MEMSIYHVPTVLTVDYFVKADQEIDKQVQVNAKKQSELSNEYRDALKMEEAKRAQIQDEINQLSELFFQTMLEYNYVILDKLGDKVYLHPDQNDISWYKFTASKPNPGAPAAEFFNMLERAGWKVPNAFACTSLGTTRVFGYKFRALDIASTPPVPATKVTTTKVIM